MCKKGRWNVSDKIFELENFMKVMLLLGRAGCIPIIPVTCDNCGNIVLVNAISQGAYLLTISKMEAQSEWW